jgi:SAM-dependent methyltransferase
MLGAALQRWIAHPATRGLDLDDPRTTALRREVVRSKPFLRKLYREWHLLVRDALPAGPGAVLELGSGAASLTDVIPDAITSEVFACPGVRVVADGCELPFADGTLRAIVLVNVLHHIPRCARFFDEAARCVRPGGRVVAIEPWVTGWSRFVYGRLHHEPFAPEARDWSFPSAGPLSSANGALPWILFERDRPAFEDRHRAWSIRAIEPLMPVSYLLSGGVSLRSLAPGWAYAPVRALERLTGGRRQRAAMFARIVLERTPSPALGA